MDLEPIKSLCIVAHDGGTKYKSILGNLGIHLGMIVFRREVVKDA